MVSNLGFIGLGLMGKPMAGHLLAAGHTIHIYDVVSAPVKELATKGAVACSSAKEVAQKSDIIFTMLPDTPDVEVVLFGKDGIAEGVKSGSIVVDMSSISPIATKEFAKKLAALGVKMLDAPVSGGQTGATNATLSILVGGEPEVFEQIKPYFKLMGKKFTHIGGHGAGQTCKVANQIVVAGTIEAVGEALVFTSKAGFDPRKVREALLAGSAQSQVLELHGQRMIEHNFVPGFRLKLFQKDINLALQAARSLGMSLPNTATSQELLNAVAAQEGLDIDHSAMVLALEKLANQKVSG
ncbi:MAG: 2-hydroxy-3-oxopropionate reductase [Chloroflexota bacterium]|nr:MAG: 2-hydroxy-3-oxopropionate reductase [Chloroflexota bacterium]